MSKLETTVAPDEGGKKGYVSVGEFLSDRKVHYEHVQLPATKNIKSTIQAAKMLKLPLEHVLRSVLLKDEEGYLLAITSCAQVIDYPELCRALHRDLNVVPAHLSPFAHLFDKTLASYPPVPNMMDIQALLDVTVVLECDQIYMQSGTGGNLIKLSGHDFKRILPSVWKEAFTYPLVDLAFSEIEVGAKEVLAVKEHFTPRRMEERVKETFEMPLMPPMADELLKLRVDPTAEAKNLARLVEKDPSLSAQLISWACSPYYGYPGKITSIDDAIIKVLGYDLVMNIALGIAIGQVMRVQNDGPIGLYNYWKHAIFNATLVERLVGLVPREQRPFRGLAYLCGLLHNFGYLLLGQLFPPQFFVLNQSILSNPTINIPQLEKQLFAADHQQLGAWLMQSWHMPEELVVAMRQHHRHDYEGDHAIYSKLTYLGNQLLAEKGMGDEVFDEALYQSVLTSLQISHDDAQAILENLWEHRDGLESVVSILSKDA